MIETKIIETSRDECAISVDQEDDKKGKIIEKEKRYSTLKIVLI